MSDGYVTGTPRLLLRLEGAAVLAASLWSYYLAGFSWLFFLILILAPDLSALGYLVGRKAGAACYNAAHTYVPPLALGCWWAAGGGPTILALAFVWAAHIGADRMLGYGLKYGSDFTSTHLGPIGKARLETAKISPAPPERAQP